MAVEAEGLKRLKGLERLKGLKRLKRIKHADRSAAKITPGARHLQRESSRLLDNARGSKH